MRKGIIDWIGLLVMIGTLWVTAVIEKEYSVVDKINVSIGIENNSTSTCREPDSFVPPHYKVK